MSKLSDDNGDPRSEPKAAVPAKKNPAEAGSLVSLLSDYGVW
jgi:hypothetical protein